jgi:hypothetical protein
MLKVLNGSKIDKSLTQNAALPEKQPKKLVQNIKN